MSYDFPSSPSIGQTFGNYIWNGAGWQLYGASPPVATAQTRSRIVNGAMQVSQENGDTASAGTAANAGYYMADQFQGRWGISPGVMVAARGGAFGFNGSLKCAYTNVTTAKGALAAADYAVITQHIEGVRVADFQWGTASAKQAILRFTVQAAVAGTYSVRLTNSGSTRSYIAQFTLLAATPTTVTLVIPGDTTGTWLKDTGLGVSIDFGIGLGSNYLGVLGWQAGNFYSAPGQVNGVSATGTFIISDVALYLDPQNTGVAPAWQMPDEAEELQACQRYYEKGQSRWDGYVTNGFVFSTPASFKALKRIAPAVSMTNNGASGFGASSAVGAFSADAAWIYRVGTATTGGNFSDFWTANSRM